MQRSEDKVINVHDMVHDDDVHEHPVWVYGPMLLITENTFPEQLLVGQQAITDILIQILSTA